MWKSTREPPGALVFGTSPDCDVRVTNEYVSGRHARITRSRGAYYVEDLGSTNGTYLDRSKVSGPTPVAIGVPIRVGKTVIELRK